MPLLWDEVQTVRRKHVSALHQIPYMTLLVQEADLGSFLYEQLKQARLLKQVIFMQNPVLTGVQPGILCLAKTNSISVTKHGTFNPQD